MTTAIRATSLAAFALSFTWGVAAAAPLEMRPPVRTFIDQMVQKHAFDRKELEALFSGVEVRNDILAAISKPAEGKSWFQYRPIFVNDERTRLGGEFWKQNTQALADAQREFGVPAEYVVAIIGVETRYGRQTGTYRVMDALSTLAFEYPPRSEFFRGQLEEYLIMAREEGLAPFSLKGSYAGAMGQPQFMPSSFRNFAVDFDGDGRRNLWSNPTDAIGSVANYFHAHGWRGDAPVVHRAKVTGLDADYDALAVRTLEPNNAFATLAAKGVSTDAAIPDDEKVALLRLEGENGPEYWIARHNFFVITRYNRSPLYAMAVKQLAEAVVALRPTPKPTTGPELQKTKLEPVKKKAEPKPWCPLCE